MAQHLDPFGRGCWVDTPLTATSEDFRVISSWVSDDYNAPRIDLLHRWNGSLGNGYHRLWATLAFRKVAYPMASPLAWMLRNVALMPSDWGAWINHVLTGELAYLRTNSTLDVVGLNRLYRIAIIRALAALDIHKWLPRLDDEPREVMWPTDPMHSRQALAALGPLSPIDGTWRERQRTDDRLLTHANHVGGCRLYFVVYPSHIGILKITTSGDMGLGHAKPLLSELRWRYPTRDVWQIETMLTSDGRTFWPHVAPWVHDGLGVEIFDRHWQPV